MKLKTIDPTHLLVVLSAGECRALGFAPEIARQSFRTRLIAARIFEAAARRCALSRRARKLSIAISSFEGRYFLLYSLLSARRFRVRGETTLCFRIPCEDALIDALRRLRRNYPDSVVSLRRLRGVYFLFVKTPFSRLRKTAALLMEYADRQEKSPAALGRIREHGELLVFETNLSRLL